MDSGQLDMLVAAPTYFDGLSCGLLGVYNGDVTDDLKAPDGTLISMNASTRDIYYDFGTKCKFICHLYRSSMQLYHNKNGH